mgnify:CR=1 FL=1
MKNVKKSVLSVLLFVFILGACVPSSSAAARASEYINQTYTDMFAGKDSGELDIDFSIQAVKNTTLLGIYKIAFYKSNGDYVTTVWGTVINGLLTNDGGRFYGGTYTFDRAESGVSYYAVVTFMANDRNGGDKFEMETSVVKAP